MGVLRKLALGLALAMALAASLPAQTGNPGPAIRVNNLTGSDTAASGAPSTITAISGVAACDTGGAPSTTINWTANGLAGAGVPTDGTAALWIGTASGRQFSAIVGLTADTVTVLDNFNISGGPGGPRNCAVGGQRASITQELAADLLGINNIVTYGGNGGWWTLELEYTGTDYTTAVTLSTTGNLACVIRGLKGAGGEYPIHRLTVAATTMWQINDCVMSGIHLLTANATGLSGRAIITDGSATLTDMVIGHSTLMAESFTVGLEARGAATSDGQYVLSTFQNNGTAVEQECGGCWWSGNYFTGNGIAFQVNNFNASGNEAFYFPLIFRNIFVGNNTAISSSQDMGAFLINNTFHSNLTAFACTSDAACNFWQIHGNTFTSNSIGARCFGTDCALDKDIVCSNNNFFGNTLDRILGFPVCPGDQAVDPDYVNGTPGPGFDPTPQTAVLCGPPAPGVAINGSATFSPDLECGAVQTNLLPSGGGGADAIF